MPIFPIYYRLPCRMCMQFTHIGRVFWKHHQAYWISCSLIQGFWWCFLPSWINSDVLREWVLWMSTAERLHDPSASCWKWSCWTVSWWNGKINDLTHLPVSLLSLGEAFTMRTGEEITGRREKQEIVGIQYFLGLFSYNANNSGLQADTGGGRTVHGGTLPLNDASQL